MKGRPPVQSLGVALGATCLVGCALIVGDPHGRLPPEQSDASDAGDASEELGSGEAGNEVDSSFASDAGEDGQGDAAEGGQLADVDSMTGCGSNCPTSTATFSCAKGGCNTSGGACTAAGQRCACDNDNQCPSGKCVPVAGQNNLSCGAQCTGTGMADGFGCQPPTCSATAFGYAPSSFTPASYTPPPNATIDCNGTYSSTTHTFTTGSCGGQAPIIHASVTQTHGGQAIDILVFKSLTITGTLTLVGANPVVLAVYGNATISGTINASANGATPGPGGNNCAAASNGTAPTSGQWEPGAGGAGQSTAGGAGGASTSAGGAAGAAQGTSTVPLTGGCAGGLPAVGSLGFSPTAGAGGGGVQISAAGSLNLAGGTILANGSNGGGGEVGKCQALYQAQNGTGGAGGGSGGVVLVEGSTVTAGTYQVAGGKGGTGGSSPAPYNLAGGAGGAAGVAGGPGITQAGATAPSGCSWGGYWSGGGGGGGSNGFSHTNTGGGACLCTADSTCSTGVCSNVSNLCTGTCSGTTTAGTYDSSNCQTLTSKAGWSCAAGNCSDVASPTGTCTAAGVPCWCTSDRQCPSGRLCAAWAGCAAGACTGSGTGDGFNCVL